VLLTVIAALQIGLAALPEVILYRTVNGQRKETSVDKAATWVVQIAIAVDWVTVVELVIGAVLEIAVALAIAEGLVIGAAPVIAVE
jgi:hypothetical protein